jgi:hypothetical protein
MPNTNRDLGSDIKSVKSITYRLSLDRTAIVVTNRYEEHNGRPLILSAEVLNDMLQQLEPQATGWIVPEVHTTLF